MQVVASFTQRRESSPSKSTSTFESIETTGNRSFPRLPEPMERDSGSSSRAPLERQQLQQVGDEHVFHQQVQSGAYLAGGRGPRVPRDEDCCGGVRGNSCASVAAVYVVAMSVCSACEVCR